MWEMLENDALRQIFLTVSEITEHYYTRMVKIFISKTFPQVVNITQITLIMQPAI